MSYLIFKILFLLLIAALCGAWLMYWWLSNRQEDVTESYEELKSKSDLFGSPDYILTRDDLDAGLTSLASRVDQIHMPDISPVEARLASIENAVSNFHAPETDLSPLHERLQYLQAKFEQPDPNFEALHSRVTGLEETLNYIANSIAQLNVGPTDLGPVESRLDNIEHAVNAIQVPEVDLGPLHSSLALLELGIEGLDIPSTDLEPVHDHIRVMDAKLNELTERLDAARKADLETITSRLASLSSVLSNLRYPDIEPLHAKMNKIEAKLTDLETTTPPASDLSSLVQHFERLENKVAAPRSDVETLNARLGALEINLSEISGALSGLALPNMQPIEHKLERIEALSERQDGARRSELDMLASRISALSSKIDDRAAPEVDLRPFHTMLLGLERAISTIDRSGVDLSPIQSRLGALENALGDIRGELMHDDQPFDSIERKLVALDGALHDLKMQKAAVDIDLEPVLDAIYRMEHKSIDFSPIIDAVHKLEIDQGDLRPVLDAVRKMEGRLVDLGAVENRLTSLEYGLAALHDMLRSRSEGSAPRNGEMHWRSSTETSQSRYSAPTPDQTEQREYVARSTSYTAPRDTRLSTDAIRSALRDGDRANLLRQAAFGPADDLELVSGVGPMLSALLNDIGVFYFWQIAEWGPAEVDWVDSKLNHFKGRIQRDDWVDQARALMDGPTAAKRPR